MANKFHMKWSSPSVSIKKMQIKTTKRITIRKRLTTSDIYRDVGETGILKFCEGNVKCYNYFGKRYGSSLQNWPHAQWLSYYYMATQKE